jgi:signal transduction histidine kinase/CheY-like chemotaxis protein
VVEEVSEEFLTQACFDFAQRERIRLLGVTSYTILPLIAMGKTIGTLHLAMTSRSRHFLPVDSAFLEVVASRCAIAVENARLYHEAQKAVVARESILAIVSHDLKNPLTSIHLTAQSLARLNLPPEKIRTMGERLRNSASLMNRMISDLLDFGKIQAGAFTVEKKSVATRDIFQDAVETMKPLALKKGIRLLPEAAAETHELFCDRGRMIQVLWNLLSNAIKFSPQGGTVSLRWVAEGEFVRFTVADSGPGIAPQDIRRVFERFWQAAPTASQGTGLGLYIAKGIVEAHGGKIWVESEPGAGAKFHFTVPLFRAPLSGTHILLVGAPDDGLRQVKALLESAGARISEALNISEALACVVKDRPDVMLTDLQHPDGDEYGLIRKVLQLVKKEKIPLSVAALTGPGKQAEADQLAEAGISASISQPVTKEKLVSSLQKLASHDPEHG